MNDRAITGVLALCPGRAAAATLEQVLEQPDLANDPVVIVGDSSRQRDKRATYRAIFSTLGRVRRPVLWVPECTEFAFEREATTRLPIRAGPAGDARRQALRSRPAGRRARRRAHAHIPAVPRAAFPTPCCLRGAQPGQPRMARALTQPNGAA